MEAGISCEGLLPSILRMQEQALGGRSQATMNKTPLNADNEDNVMVLGEEELWKLQGLMGFHVNHQVKMTLILTTMIRKDKHGQRH